MSKFLAIAEQGKNHWWRYLISIPAILLFWLLLGSIPVVLVMLAGYLDGNPATYFTENAEMIGFHPIWMYLATLLSFIPLIVATLMATRWIHSRRTLTLFTSDARINWKRIAAGFVAWFALCGLASLAEALFYPGRYQLSFDGPNFAIFLVASLILIPLQTSAEEIFFRGFLLQALGLRLKKVWLLCVLSGILFALPHYGNPELKVSFGLVISFYFAFGAFMAWVTLRDGTLELALGVHAANNLFSAMVANYPDGALRTSSLFTVGVLDPVYGLASSLVIMLFFFLIFFARRIPAPA